MPVVVVVVAVALALASWMPAKVADALVVDNFPDVVAIYNTVAFAVVADTAIVRFLPLTATHP